jgi:hypothetical protein
MVVMGADSASTMSLMMLVQLMPEARPDKARALLLLDVTAAIRFLLLFFFAAVSRLDFSKFSNF